MAEAMAAAKDINLTGPSTEFYEDTAAALTDREPDRFAAPKEHFLQTPGVQPDSGRCLSPGYKLCHCEMDQQQRAFTPPVSPEEDLPDPSSWQIVEPDGKKTFCFAEAEPENDEPELPVRSQYPSPSASSASIDSKETAVAIEAAEGTTSGPAIPDMTWGSPFPESPPINNITVTTEIHSTTSERYVYALRVEYRFDTNFGGANGLHNELGTLSDVNVKGVFSNLEAANEEVERLYQQLKEDRGLTDMDAVDGLDEHGGFYGDRLFMFLDDPRTFESWSIYTDKKVLL